MFSAHPYKCPKRRRKIASDETVEAAVWAMKNDTSGAAHLVGGGNFLWTVFVNTRNYGFTMFRQENCFGRF